MRTTAALVLQSLRTRVLDAPAVLTGSFSVPRFYFDVHDGVDIHDEVGRELADRAAVREEALAVAIRLLAAEAADAKETTLVLTVRDEAGAVPLKIRLVSQIEES